MIFPEQDPKIDDVVPTQGRNFRVFFICSLTEQGQGFKPSAAPLYPNMGQVPRGQGRELCSRVWRIARPWEETFSNKWQNSRALIGGESYNDVTCVTQHKAISGKTFFCSEKYILQTIGNQRVKITVESRSFKKKK